MKAKRVSREENDTEKATKKLKIEANTQSGHFHQVIDPPLGMREEQQEK
jgi:hypothetical protein